MNEDLRKMLEAAREASRGLNRCQEADINRLLLSAADKVEAAIDKILAANATDLARMDKDNPKYDRLKLTPDRIRAIAADMRSVASLPSPLRRTLAEWTQPNGMRIRKVSVPFGVVGVIYEARPNVTFDVFSILMKSGTLISAPVSSFAGLRVLVAVLPARRQRRRRLQPRRRRRASRVTSRRRIRRA